MVKIYVENKYIYILTLSVVIVNSIYYKALLIINHTWWLCMEMYTGEDVGVGK